MTAVSAKFAGLLGIIRRNAGELLFAACCLFVAAVSVHDAILIVLNDDVIPAVEKNPLGRWLLQVQGGEVWLFVAVKLAGTAVVCAVLVTLYQQHRRIAWAAAAVLACFQFGLLLFLTFT